MAAAGVTVIVPVVPDGGRACLAVIVCVPAVSSVAVTVALPPVNERDVKLAPPKLSDSVTVSLKPVTTLLN